MTLKTKPTAANVSTLLDNVVPEQKRKDCYEIAAMMADITGEPAVVWGPSMIGFGKYRYTNATKKEAAWFIAGFSPRKQNIAIYLMAGAEAEPDLLSKLGRYETGKSCLYIDKLADIDMAVLKKVISASVAYMKENFG